MSDERLTTSSFQSLSVIHIIKSKSCLEEICPCQSYGSSRPLRSGCSSSTSGLSSFSRRVRGRLRGSGARRNEGGRDVVLTDADFPSNERPCGRSSACTHSCVRLKRKRRNRRPIRHAWLNDANSVAPVVHSHARGAILSRCRDRLLNPDKPDHITSYSGLLQRSSQLANALDSIGIKPGDRVATLAWTAIGISSCTSVFPEWEPFVTRSIRGCSWSRLYTSSTTPKMWLCSSIWLSSISYTH